MTPINYSHPGIRQLRALNIFQSWRATRFNSRAAFQLTVEGESTQPSCEHAKLIRPAKEDGANQVFQINVAL